MIKLALFITISLSTLALCDADYSDKTLEEINAAIAAQKRFIAAQQKIIDEIEHHYHVKLGRQVRRGSRDWNRYWNADKQGKLALQKLRVLERLKFEKDPKLKAKTEKESRAHVKLSGNNPIKESKPKAKRPDQNHGGSSTKESNQKISDTIANPNNDLTKKSTLETKAIFKRDEKYNYIIFHPQEFPSKSEREKREKHFDNIIFEIAENLEYPEFHHSPKIPEGAININKLNRVEHNIQFEYVGIGNAITNSKANTVNIVVESAFTGSELFTGMSYKTYRNSDVIEEIGYYKNGRKHGWWLYYDELETSGSPTTVITGDTKTSAKLNYKIFLSGAKYFVNGFEELPSVLDTPLSNSNVYQIYIGGGGRNSGFKATERKIIRNAIWYAKDGKILSKSYINSFGYRTDVSYHKYSSNPTALLVQLDYYNWHTQKFAPDGTPLNSEGFPKNHLKKQVNHPNENSTNSLTNKPKLETAAIFKRDENHNYMVTNIPRLSPDKITKKLEEFNTKIFEIAENLGHPKFHHSPKIPEGAININKLNRTKQDIKFEDISGTYDIKHLTCVIELAFNGSELFTGKSYKTYRNSDVIEAIGNYKNGRKNGWWLYYDKLDNSKASRKLNYKNPLRKAVYFVNGFKELPSVLKTPLPNRTILRINRLDAIWYTNDGNVEYKSYINSFGLETQVWYNKNNSNPIIMNIAFGYEKLYETEVFRSVIHVQKFAPDGTALNSEGFPKKHLQKMTKPIDSGF